MKKGMIIVGAGPLLALSMAKKFASEGYTIGLISRNDEKLNTLTNELSDMGHEAYYATADAGSEEELRRAITELKSKLPAIHILHYNAVAFNLVPILKNDASSLVKDYQVGVANVLFCVHELLDDLEENKGSVLLTGGVLALHPDYKFGTINLSKAGIMNLNRQLHQALKEKGIYVGSLMVMGFINKNSKTHNPDLLAEHFHAMNVERKEIQRKV